jgi:hypothetical protein
MKKREECKPLKRMDVKFTWDCQFVNSYWLGSLQWHDVNRVRSHFYDLEIVQHEKKKYINNIPLYLQKSEIK